MLFVLIFVVGIAGGVHNLLQFRHFLQDSGHIIFRAAEEFANCIGVPLSGFLDSFGTEIGLIVRQAFRTSNV